MKTFLKLLAAFLIFGAISGLCLVLFLSFDPDSLHIDASEPRTETKWWVEATKNRASPGYTVSEFLTQNTAVSTRSDMPELYEYKPGLGTLVSPFGIDGERCLELVAIGVALPVATNGKESHLVGSPFQYYDATGTRILSDAEKQVFGKLSKNAYTNGVFPKICLVFRKLVPSKLVGFRLLDQRTRYVLSSSRGTRDGSEYLQVSTSIQTWRPSNVRAVFDLVVGEREWVNLEGEVGSSVTSGAHHIEIVAVEPKIALQIEFPEGGSTTVRSSGDSAFMVSAFPFGEKSAYDFRLRNQQDSKVLKVQTVSYLGYLVSSSVPSSEIPQFEIGIPQNYQRVRIDLPPIPELPRENDQIENMLDLKLTYIETSRGQMRWASGMLGQFRIEDYHEHLTEEQRNTNVVFENATLRQVLDSRLEKVSPLVRVKYNPDDFTLMIGSPDKSKSSRWYHRFLDF